MRWGGERRSVENGFVIPSFLPLQKETKLQRENQPFLSANNDHLSAHHANGLLKMVRTQKKREGEREKGERQMVKEEKRIDGEGYEELKEENREKERKEKKRRKAL